MNNYTQYEVTVSEGYLICFKRHIGISGSNLTSIHQPSTWLKALQNGKKNKLFVSIRKQSLQTQVQDFPKFSYTFFTSSHGTKAPKALVSVSLRLRVRWHAPLQQASFGQLKTSHLARRGTSESHLLIWIKSIWAFWELIDVYYVIYIYRYKHIYYKLL